MFVVSGTVILSLQLILNIVAHVTAPAMWLVPRVVLISLTVTGLMTWLVQPWAARLLENWLYRPRGTGSRS